MEGLDVSNPTFRDACKQKEHDKLADIALERRRSHATKKGTPWKAETKMEDLSRWKGFKKGPAGLNKDSTRTPSERQRKSEGPRSEQSLTPAD